MRAPSERAAWLVAATLVVGALVVWLRPFPEVTVPAPEAQPAVPERASPAREVAATRPDVRDRTGADAGASTRAEPPDATASAAAVGEPANELRVLVTGLPDGVSELPVSLVYADARTGDWATTMLFVGGALPASMALGAGPTRPSHVDFGFPTTGRSMCTVGDEMRFELAAPALGTLEIEVLGADGQPLPEAARLDVRAPGSPWPASRWHSRVVPVSQPRVTLRVEVGTGQLEVRATTESGSSGTAWTTAPTVAGQTVTVRVWIAPGGR